MMGPPLLPERSRGRATAGGMREFPSMSVRCYQCGKTISVETAERRDVTTGYGNIGNYDAPALGSFRHWQRVDLCGECAAQHDVSARWRFWFTVACFLFAVVPAILVLALLVYLSFHGKPSGGAW